MVRSAGRLRLTLPRALLALVLLVTSAAALAFPRAGSYLVETDPLSKSDVLYVLAGTKIERALEAVDLYKAGFAPEVLLSPGRREPAELMLRARGVKLPSDSEIVRDTITQLGVPPSVVVMPDGSVDNTAQEADLLRQLAAERGWHSVIVVTSKYHSRRSAFAFRRALRDTDVRIEVAPTRYDPSDPQHWWRNRADLRWVLLEWEKLVLYRLGLSG
jgi:uncharacterized SAM-binding protein YcdF (DUF218 family)